MGGSPNRCAVCGGPWCAIVLAPLRYLCQACWLKHRVAKGAAS